MRALKRIVVMATAMVFSGCTNSVVLQREAEVFSSLPYDEVSCGDLAERRDALAARHGLARDVAREAQPETNIAGFGLIVPDMRDPGQRETARAIGEITAMNQSMKRRHCGGA